jgi:hypothetical protein
MALLFIDSFDHYATADLGLKWSSVTTVITPPAILPTAGRRGGGALSVPAFATVRKDLAPVTTLITGFAMRLGGYASNSDTPGSSSWMTLGNADGSALYFSIAQDGAIIVSRRIGDGSSAEAFQRLGITTAAVLQANVYTYVEVKATIKTTNTGQVKVLVNGAAVLNLNNIQTNGWNSATENISRVLLPGLSVDGPATSYDDLYLCDTTGTVNADFFGDVRIDVTRPNADGTYQDFTPDSGSAHFSRVNEAVADQLTYVSSATVGAKDTYQFTDLNTVVGVVRGVQIVDAAVKDDAGLRSISHIAKSGASEQYSGAMPLSTDRKLYTSIHETDPATGNKWTQAGLNSAEFGIVVAQ